MLSISAMLSRAFSWASSSLSAGSAVGTGGCGVGSDRRKRAANKQTQYYLCTLGWRSLLAVSEFWINTLDGKVDTVFIINFLNDDWNNITLC